MPANNVVLGGLTVAGLAYGGYTWQQKQLLEREEREARAETEKRQRDYEERMEHQRQTEGAAAWARKNVGYEMSRARELILMQGMLQDIYNLISSRAGRPSLELPLLKLAGAQDAPADAVLGAGLALGMSADDLTFVLDRICGYHGGQPPLGMAASSLSREAVVAIAAALERPQLGIGTSNLAALLHDPKLMGTLFHFSRTDTSEPTKPTILFAELTRQTAEGFRSVVLELGLSLAPLSYFERTPGKSNRTAGNVYWTPAFASAFNPPHTATAESAGAATAPAGGVRTIPHRAARDRRAKHRPANG